MKIEQVKTFLAIVDQGSFRGASQTLHKTQPAITKSVQSLESSLGFELFDRSLHHPQLTHQGRIFHTAAEHFYAQYQRLSHVKEALKSDIEPVVKMAIDVCLPPQLLWQALEPSFNQFKETEFQIESCTLNGGNERLLAGDVTLTICEHLYPDEPLEAISFIDIPLVPVASPQFIADNASLLACPEQVWNTQQIILADTAKTSKKSFGVVGGHRQIVVNDIANKHSLICEGLGWGRMPMWMVEHALKAGQLQVLDYPHIAKRTLPLSLIRHRNQHHGRVNEHLWAQLLNLS